MQLLCLHFSAQPPPPFPATQVFGPKLQLRAPCLAAFTAELLQPAAAEGQSQLLCPGGEESLVGAVHCRLLELVSRTPLVPATAAASALFCFTKHAWLCC